MPNPHTTAFREDFERRFVILHHIISDRRQGQTHFDLMIEGDGKLLTWALPEFPGDITPLLAKKLPDHRLRYLTYEGEISGHRGHVKRVEEGTCRILDEDSSKISLQLIGKNGLSGEILLKMVDVSNEGQEFWEFKWC